MCSIYNGRERAKPPRWVNWKVEEMKNLLTQLLCCSASCYTTPTPASARRSHFIIFLTVLLSRRSIRSSTEECIYIRRRWRRRLEIWIKIQSAIFLWSTAQWNNNYTRQRSYDEMNFEDRRRCCCCCRSAEKCEHDAVVKMHRARAHQTFFRSATSLRFNLRRPHSFWWEANRRIIEDSLVINGSQLNSIGSFTIFFAFLSSPLRCAP